jgi:hypothetical protein
MEGNRDRHFPLSFQFNALMPSTNAWPSSEWGLRWIGIDRNDSDFVFEDEGESREMEE